MSPRTTLFSSVGLAILVASCTEAPRPLVGDASVDATDAAVDATLCYGSSFVTACLSAVPTQPLEFAIGTTLLDTDAASNCTQVISQPHGGPEVCVIAASAIIVTSAVIATGSRPLVLIGTDTVTIHGTLDVSSTAIPRRTGAGGSQGPCEYPGLAYTDDAGGGGGAGGSLGTKGGNGGTGNQTAIGPDHTVASGGIAGATQAMPGYLRGGCAGGKGGAANLARGSAGGDGGGAVYIIAGNKIAIAGDVFASGAGGGVISGFDEQQGGGGGGSGGVIGLEAPAIEIASTSRLVANGGGGGGGGGPDGGGGVGGDGTTTAWDTPARGGDRGFGISFPGVLAGGAPGTAGQGDGMAGPSSDCGGGGGGGGLGLLWIDGAMSGGTTMVSPQPTIAPPR